MLPRTRKRTPRWWRSFPFGMIPTIALTPSTSWNSFEQFRTVGANSLATITAGTVGTLQTKTGQYRILNEADFQQLVGLATDVEWLQPRFSFPPLKPEDIPAESEDEVILAPDLLDCPLG
jgi:hypothetical protein